MFKVGDLVKHKASFLRSIQWYTDVPKDGCVVGIMTVGGQPDVLRVEWCDEPGVVRPILACHVLAADAPDYTGL